MPWFSNFRLYLCPTSQIPRDQKALQTSVKEQFWCLWGTKCSYALSGHTGNGLKFLKPKIHLNNHEKLLPKSASNFCEGAVLVFFGEQSVQMHCQSIQEMG